MAIKKCQARTLTPYLDGELIAETRLQVEEHLRSCAACGALLDEATSARERVRGMGRSIIPATVLMPALEVFRDRAGIGQPRHLELDEIPALPVEAVAEGDGSDIYDDPRYAAVLAGVSLEGVGLVAGIVPEVAPVEMAPFEAGEDQTVTWVAMEGPAPAEEPAVAPTLHVPDPPVVEDPFHGVGPERASGMFSAIAQRPGPLPWEEDAHPTDNHSALEERPDLPEPPSVPPWGEAETADAADMEARGRRLVEEDLAAHRAMQRESEAAWHAASFITFASEAPVVGRQAAEPGDEVATAVTPRAAATPALGQQIEIGLAAAAVIVVLLVGAIFVLPKLTGNHAVTPVASSNAKASPAPRATPPAAASPAPAANPTVPAGASIPQLSGVVKRGAGGAGYRVLRVRSGSPGAGVYRIVFDLEGTGAAPDAQLGRGPDGSLYLRAAAISIDPALLATFAPTGPISGITAVGAGSGLGVKLASSNASSPQYTMYYLTGPNRLVIDLR